MRRSRMLRGALVALILAMAPAAERAHAQMDEPAATNATLAPLGLRVQIDPGDSPREYSQSIKILLLLTALSLAPSAIIMTTCFTRILIVLGFLRQALGTQQTPPGQILAGIALFLTIFIMAPVWQQINTKAIQPYLAEQITQQEAWEQGVAPLRAFMEKQTGAEELALFVELSGAQRKNAQEPIPLEVLIPSYMISELKTAFQLGFLIYLPFLVIDLVIAASLMSLGMMMLPPMMISLPLKLLFFVLADGWNLMIRGLVSSFSV